MIRKARVRGGGSRLSRSETVTVRLDPRLNYLCELAARVERRTKSSFIEAMLDQKVHETLINPRFTEETIGQLADDLWHVEDYRRLIALAKRAPHLMTIDEQQIWAIVEDADYFWYGRWQLLSEDAPEFMHGWDGPTLERERVRDLWPVILKVAAGEEDREVLPRRRGDWAKVAALGGDVPERYRPKLPTESLDDDKPF
jgi:hypothetical protein